MATDFCYGGCLQPLKPGEKICPFCGHDNSVRQNPSGFLAEGTILNGKYLTGRLLEKDHIIQKYLGLDLDSGEKVTVREYAPLTWFADRNRHGNIILWTPECFIYTGRGMKRYYELLMGLRGFTAPGIEQVLDMFRENNTFYAVTGPFGEISFREKVKNFGGRIPWEEAVGLMLPLMRDLEMLHQRRTMHGFITPECIRMITRDGQKDEKCLLDGFGEHRKIYEGSIDNTNLRKPDDMWPILSPECLLFPKKDAADAEKPDNRTDIYSVCAVLYYAVTGTVINTANRLAGAEVKPFSSFGLAVPEEIEASVMHGLALRKDARPKNMRELADELSAALEKSRKISGPAEDSEPEPDISIHAAEEGPAPEKEEQTSGSGEENPGKGPDRIVRYCCSCLRELDPMYVDCPYCGYQNPFTDFDRFALGQGTLLQNGKYMLGKLLGRGSYSYTYLALNRNTGEKAAIKEFYPEYLELDEDPEKREAGLKYFAREAELLDELGELPGVVRKKDFFREKDTAFLVENLVEGHKLFEEDETPGLAECLNALYPVMEILSRVHEKGIVHCDLGPWNILVDDQDRKWLLDFGSALKIGEKAKPGLMKTINTLFPPELQTGEDPVGPWTDVFLMCGIISRAVEGIPSTVHAVLKKGMARDCSIRYQSMEELETTLKRAFADQMTVPNKQFGQEDNKAAAEKGSVSSAGKNSRLKQPERYEIYFTPLFSSEQEGYYYYQNSVRVGESFIFSRFNDETYMRFGDLRFSSRFE
ncbi:MAG: hypothetical protein IKP86_04925 [Anaerolineaceae bacterium]|nr:hypothetical protein [Anaerolineaceae bacterium]